MPQFRDEAKITALEQQAIDWLVRLRSDDLNDDEVSAFADWLSQDIAHSEAFSQAENLFNDMVVAAESSAVNSSNQFSSDVLPQQMPVNPAIELARLSDSRSAVHRSRWLVSSLAVAAVWLFAIGLVIPRQANLLDDFLSDHHTRTGEMRQIRLADGSQLLLNTNSAVSVDFSESSRKITLHHGQVRFSVATEHRPFEVVSDELVIRALGTVFEVYQDDSSETNVIVQEHAVDVSIQAGKGIDGKESIGPVNVQAQHKLHYRPGSALQRPRLVELDQMTAWQQHRLVINDRPLAELIVELDRYRIGRIFLSDAELKKLRVTGVFSLDNPDDVLASVCQALALKRTQLGPWWVLLHR